MLNFKEWFKTEWGIGNSFDKDGNIVTPTWKQNPTQKVGIRKPKFIHKDRPSFELNDLEQSPSPQQMQPTELYKNTKDTSIAQKIDNLEMRISRLEKRT